MKFDKLKTILEGKLKQGDIDLEEYYKDQNQKDLELDEGPYAVGWSGQSHEWYGDEDMKNGRYKPKGDGGQITDINIKSLDKANKLADKLDDLQKAGKLDDAIGGRMGKDHYIIDYHGSFVVPMKKLDGYYNEMIKWWRPKDHKGN